MDGVSLGTISSMTCQTQNSLSAKSRETSHEGLSPAITSPVTIPPALLNISDSGLLWQDQTTHYFCLSQWSACSRSDINSRRVLKREPGKKQQSLLTKPVWVHKSSPRRVKELSIILIIAVVATVTMEWRFTRDSPHLATYGLKYRHYSWATFFFFFQSYRTGRI